MEKFDFFFLFQLSFFRFDPSWNAPAPQKLEPIREKLITNSFGTFNVKQYAPTPGGPRPPLKVIQRKKSHPSYVAFGGHGRVKAPKQIAPVAPRRAPPPVQRQPEAQPQFIDLTAEDKQASEEIFMDESGSEPQFVPKIVCF